MRSEKAVRGLVMAAGVLAAMTIASPAASASYMHNIIIDGRTLPTNAHSVSVWAPGDGTRPSGCVKNLNAGTDVNTGILIPSGESYSFWAETGSTCGHRFSGRTVQCLCNVTLRESDPWDYRVKFVTKISSTLGG